MSADFENRIISPEELPDDLDGENPLRPNKLNKYKNNFWSGDRKARRFSLNDYKAESGRRTFYR